MAWGFLQMFANAVSSKHCCSLMTPTLYLIPFCGDFVILEFCGGWCRGSSGSGYGGDLN